MAKNDRMDKQFADQVFVSYMIDELARQVEEEDEAFMLREALLASIWLLQGLESEQADDFIEFILNRFPPLAGHFINDEHALFVTESGVLLGVRGNGMTKNRTRLFLKSVKASDLM